MTRYGTLQLQILYINNIKAAEGFAKVRQIIMRLEIHRYRRKQCGYSSKLRMNSFKYSQTVGIVPHSKKNASGNLALKNNQKIVKLILIPKKYQSARVGREVWQSRTSILILVLYLRIHVMTESLYQTIQYPVDNNQKFTLCIFNMVGGTQKWPKSR